MADDVFLKKVKINELPDDPNFSENRLTLSGDPSTGKLYKVKIEQWINELSSLGLSFKGPADPSTDPGTPENPVFYTATQEGTYTNFPDENNTPIELEEGENLALLTWNGSYWTKQVVDIDIPVLDVKKWTISDQGAEQGTVRYDSYDNGLYVVKEGQTGGSVNPSKSRDKWDRIGDVPPKYIGVNELKILDISDNIFNKENVIEDIRINSLGVEEQNTDYVTSEFIPVEVGEEYQRYKNSPIAFFDAGKNFLSGLTAKYNFIVPENARYIKTSFLKTDLDNAFVAIRIGDGSGNSYTPYGVSLKEEIKVKQVNIVNRTIEGIKIKRNTVTNEEVDFISTGYNLLNTHDPDVQENTRITSAGDIASNPDYFTSGFIPVKENTFYETNASTPNAFYDENKTFLSGTFATAHIETPTGAHYLRKSWEIEKLHVNAIINEGDELLPYEDYYQELTYKKDYNQEDESLPEFAKSELESGIKRVYNAQKGKSFLSFIFITDSHFGLPGNTKLSEKVCAEFAKENMVDFFVHGGDISDASGTTRDEALQRIKEMKDEMSGITIPAYWVLGNHDLNYKLSGTDDNIFPVEFYNLYNRQSKWTTKTNSSDPHNNYFYVDYESYKIRVVILNSNDTATGTEYYNLGVNQLDFIQNDALDLPDNSWGVLFIMHFYYDSQGIAPKFVPIINQWKQEDKGTMIGVISGHLHRDDSSNSDGYWNVVSDCSLIEDPLYIGTKNEICFSVFTIDTDQQKIISTRFGRGSDRSFDY